PRFVRLSGMAPVYVPPRTLAIDPERGRFAGPTAPTPGIQFYREYRLRYWEALSLEPLTFDRKLSGVDANPIAGECVVATPSLQSDGVFTFASDSTVEGLTDAHGIRLMLGFEGGPVLARPQFDERLLIALEPTDHRRESSTICVLLAPGEGIQSRIPLCEQGVALDRFGLARLFSIEDEWGWDRFPAVRFVTSFGRNTLPDNTVEVDVQRGQFRINAARSDMRLTTRYFRRFDLAAAKRRAEEVLRAELPLGSAATLVFRDTAPGRTEVHRL
ncbi:MAG TPA: hypothetical protein VIV60_01050, partial [Polyangiaceae bacterium]